MKRRLRSAQPRHSSDTPSVARSLSLTDRTHVVAFSDHLTASRRTGGVDFLVAQYLARMPKDEAAAARQLLATDLSARQVAEAFAAEGYPCSESAVTNWRRARDQGRVE